MGMKRPNLVRWSPYMDEWLDALESSQDALESDKTLCQWIRLQRLADELGSKLSLDQVCHIDVSDPKIECALKQFERHVNDWHGQMPEAKPSPHLTFGFHTVNLFMYEAAMHFDQSVDDLKTPRTRQGDHDGDGSWSEPLNTSHIKALTTCLTSIHGILTIFSSFSTEDVQTLPIFYFIRLAYASLWLIKMYLTASTPGSELSKVISIEEMKVAQHLDSALYALRAAADGGKARTARIFLMVLVMLKNCYERQRDGKSSSSEDNGKSFKLEAQPVDAGRNTPSSNDNNIWYAPYSTSAPSIGPAPLAYPADYYPLDNGGLQGMDPGLEQALGMMFGDGDLSAMFTDDGFMGSGVVQTAPGVYEHMG
ncbi:MAG: hypothetical protein LQ347_003205 [Umbilicaria vellea]|nr:MAG: hypothetical protein LQ347_003205 [Umbilicaria vellea]